MSNSFIYFPRPLLLPPFMTRYLSEPYTKTASALQQKSWRCCIADIAEPIIRSGRTWWENSARTAEKRSLARKSSGDTKALKAIADRTGDVLRVTCPHCQFRSEFPKFDMVHSFLCHECGEPVAVEEPVQ
jgi:hypothetical protein